MQSTSCVQRNDVCRLTEPSSICRESSACVPDPSIEASLFSLRGNPAPISASTSSVPLLSFTDSCNTESSGHAFHPDHALQNIAKSGNVVPRLSSKSFYIKPLTCNSDNASMHIGLLQGSSNRSLSLNITSSSHITLISIQYIGMMQIQKLSPQSRQYRDLQLVNMMHHTAFSFKGLHAGMDIQSQLEISELMRNSC
ncbi:hypothetical protein BASA83_011164 [Batrachochytrium salamandrivorans]|nr:hypothetical protein BASA83_011164 [Batrachochytrium salamandrivorans]